MTATEDAITDLVSWVRTHLAALFYFIALALYVFPAGIVAIEPSTPRFPLVYSIIGGVGIFLLTATVSLKLGTNEYRNIDRNPDRGIRNQRDFDSLLTEYRELGSEVRYRDRIILRSMYFAFAVVALLGAILVQLPAYEPQGFRFQPAVTLIGSAMSFGFLMVSSSHRKSRKQLWERRRQLEEFTQFARRLTVQANVRIEKHNLITNLSSGRYIELIHGAFALMWLALYLISTSTRGPIELPTGIIERILVFGL